MLYDYDPTTAGDSQDNRDEDKMSAAEDSAHLHLRANDVVHVISKENQGILPDGSIVRPLSGIGMMQEAPANCRYVCRVVAWQIPRCCWLVSTTVLHGDNRRQRQGAVEEHSSLSSGDLKSRFELGV